MIASATYTLTAADALSLSVASGFAGAAAIIIVLLVWVLIRDARDARDRRDHYVSSRRTPTGI